MKELHSARVTSVIHSKRANFYYLEHCKVLLKGGVVHYVTQEDKFKDYWNLPVANSTFLLLGSGTSITQQAMRVLAKAGVTVGFCGSGGTPLYSGMEVVWMTPLNEYRPTEYLQKWVSFWFDEALRLKAARHLQILRRDFLVKSWKTLFPDSFAHSLQVSESVERLDEALQRSHSFVDLFSAEAHFTRELYKIAVRLTKTPDFRRAKRAMGHDLANRHLDQGNYLAYGLAASACWVLGIPHSLPLLHGKTRRGGLVFDVADLVKDALILPNAFVSASNGLDSSAFKISCVEMLQKAGALDYMIDSIKEIANRFGAHIE